MSNYKTYALPYQDDLIDRYQALRPLPDFILLESIDRHHGRYDIVSAYPYDKMVLPHGKENPVAFLSTVKERLAPISTSLNLPFQGGAIGFFSYDLAMVLAGLPMHAVPALPQEIPLAQIGFYDWAIITDHQTREVNLYAGNQQDATPRVVEEILARWHQGCTHSYIAEMHAPFTPLISQEEYRRAFTAIKQVLKKGRCYQVNYTQPFNTHFTGDSWGLYTRVRKKNPVPFAAYVTMAEGELISFSPERFLRMDQGQLLASPIKGTIKRSADAMEDEALRQVLAASEKNRAENVMIVDMMRNDLSKIAKPASVRVSSLCEVQSYAAVHHLVSDVEAQSLDYLHPLEVFLSCFPGASITGAPKREAMKVIAEQERYTRGAYCGSIGYFSQHGHFDMNIAIRTLVAQANVLSLSAGGALVMDSECEDEYQECLIKIQAINKGIR